LELKTVMSEQIEFGQPLFQFSVNTTKKNLVVCASSGDERDEWLSFITYARAGCSGNLPMLSRDKIKAISSDDNVPTATATDVSASTSSTTATATVTATVTATTSVNSPSIASGISAKSLDSSTETYPTFSQMLLVRALYPYNGRTASELTFQANDEFILLERRSQGWCLGEFNRIQGFFPESFVQILGDAPSSLTRDDDALEIESSTSRASTPTASVSAEATDNISVATATATATATADVDPNVVPLTTVTTEVAKTEPAQSGGTKQAMGHRTRPSQNIGKYVCYYGRLRCSLCLLLAERLTRF
jgi:hypothetical protein